MSIATIPAVRINPSLRRIGTTASGTRRGGPVSAVLANDNAPTSHFVPVTAEAILARAASTSQIAAAYSTAPAISPGQFFEIYA